MKLLELKRIKELPVMQATFNPKGPGAVRIHLVPPRTSLFGKIAPALVFINGSDILPVGKSHTILLANFMEELNKYEGRAIREKDMQNIVKKAVKQTQKVYYRTSKKKMEEDLNYLVSDFCELAYGRKPKLHYDVISIGEYAKFMEGPHRMDLMVSAMTTPSGKWHCNNRCLHCYAAGQKLSSQIELSTEEWKQVIDKMYDAHVTQVTFTGGEPTLRKDLPELIHYAKYFISRVNTNGILLTEQYCERLMEAELDSIQITLYSADEAIHNQLVGTNTWEYTVQGIKNALKAGLSVSINTPLCSINQDYTQTLQFLHKLGITYVSCSSIITTGNALKEKAERTQLTEEELITILEEASNYCNKKEMELSFTSPGWVNENELHRLRLKVPTCGACLSNMAITPNGKVVPCQSWLGGLELGDIRLNKWSNIWNSEKCKQIRDQSSKMEGICPLKCQKEKRQ